MLRSSRFVSRLWQGPVGLWLGPRSRRNFRRVFDPRPGAPGVPRDRSQDAPADGEGSAKAAARQRDQLRGYVRLAGDEASRLLMLRKLSRTGRGAVTNTKELRAQYVIPSAPVGGPAARLRPSARVDAAVRRLTAALPAWHAAGPDAAGTDAKGVGWPFARVELPLEDGSNLGFALLTVSHGVNVDALRISLDGCGVGPDIVRCLFPDQDSVSDILRPKFAEAKSVGDVFALVRAMQPFAPGGTDARLSNEMLAEHLVQLAAILRGARASKARVSLTPLKGAKPAAVVALAELFAAGCRERGVADDDDDEPFRGILEIGVSYHQHRSAAHRATLERQLDEASREVCDAVAAHAASKLLDFSDDEVVRLTVAVATMMAPRPGREAPAEGTAVGDFYARALGSLQRRVCDFTPECLVDVAAAFAETAHSAIRAPSLFVAIERAAKLDSFPLHELFNLSHAFFAARVSSAQRLAQAALREAANRGDAVFCASDIYHLASVLDDAQCTEETRDAAREAGLYALMHRGAAVCAKDLGVGQTERISACLSAAGVGPPPELLAAAWPSLPDPGS